MLMHSFLDVCVLVAICVQLFADACPKTAENFLKLCTHENDIKPSKNGLKPGQPVGFCRSQFHHAQKSFCAAGVSSPMSSGVVGACCALVPRFAFCDSPFNRIVNEKD